MAKKTKKQQMQWIYTVSKVQGKGIENISTYLHMYMAQAHGIGYWMQGSGYRVQSTGFFLDEGLLNNHGRLIKKSR